MGTTQLSNTALDRKGHAVPMVAGDFGDIETLVLTVPDNTATPLSAAADYPATPTVLAWMLQNFNTEANRIAFVSGANVAMNLGVFLGKAQGPAPSVLQLLTDPGKTYVIQNSGAPVTYILTLCGKNLEAPA